MRYYDRKMYNRIKDERIDCLDETTHAEEVAEKAARIEQYAAQVADRTNRLPSWRDESWQEGEIKDELTYFAPADRVAETGGLT